MGLGNPGPEYADTRHNLGFRVADLLAGRWKAGAWTRAGDRLETRATIAGREIVLVKRAIEPGYGKWVFPGGYVDRGEEITLAAIREAKEEAGVDVRLDHLINIYSYPGRTPIVVVYAATYLGGTLAVDDEGLEVRTFEARNIPWGELAFRSTHEALRDFLHADEAGPVKPR